MTRENRRELHQLEAWGIAQKVHIGERIPVGDHADLRSELYEKYAMNAAYFETARDFGGAVCHAMKNDIRDEIKHHQTKKEQFRQSMISLDQEPPKDKDGKLRQFEDPNMTPEKFFGGLDRAERRRKMKNWRRKFRRQVRRLDDGLRDFLFKLAEADSQEELASATGLCRKSCYLRRQELKQIFADLLREHREIKTEA